MTLDECIAECERITRAAEPLKQTEAYKYNRQLAEWLMELKALKDFANFVAESVLEEDWEESADFYAEVLCRKLTKLGKLKVVDNKYMGVNADDE